MENALIELSENFEAVMQDGISGKEPFLNASLMRNAALAKAKELATLPQFDLTTENGRKGLRAAIKPIKQVFSDFEKNLKVVKKMYLEIPKMCDASSKAVRDVAEPEIERAEMPFRALKEQEALTQKWWKKEGIPLDEISLAGLLLATKEAKPLPYSSAGEKADFYKFQEEYAKALEECLSRLRAAERAKAEEREKQAKEAEALRMEAERQQKERLAIEAERAKLEAEAAEIERLKQAAVNPANAESEQGAYSQGAPPASMDENRRRAIRREALAAIEEILLCPFNEEGHALEICKQIHAGRIPHVRFVYE